MQPLESPLDFSNELKHCPKCGEPFTESAKNWVCTPCNVSMPIDAVTNTTNFQIGLYRILKKRFGETVSFRGKKIDLGLALQSSIGLIVFLQSMSKASESLPQNIFPKVMTYSSPNTLFSVRPVIAECSETQLIHFLGLAQHVSDEAYDRLSQTDNPSNVFSLDYLNCDANDAYFMKLENASKSLDIG